jgi:hypothetical protein
MVNEWFPQVPAGGISFWAVVQLFPAEHLNDVLEMMLMLPFAFVWYRTLIGVTT